MCPARPRSSPSAVNRREDITGDSVSATTPEMATAPASVNANSRKSEPGEAALQTDRRVDGRERDRHRDDQAQQLARAQDRGLKRRVPLAEAPLDVFDDDDRVVDDQSRPRARWPGASAG